ncbi:MAG: hypothetical protein ACLFNU_08950 [Bacteroidales bacterium]
MKKSKLFVFGMLLVSAFILASCGSTGEKVEEEKTEVECNHEKADSVDCPSAKAEDHDCPTAKSDKHEHDEDCDHEHDEKKDEHEHGEDCDH